MVAIHAAAVAVAIVTAAVIVASFQAPMPRPPGDDVILGGGSAGRHDAGVGDVAGLLGAQLPVVLHEGLAAQRKQLKMRCMLVAEFIAIQELIKCIQVDTEHQHKLKSMQVEVWYCVSGEEGS